MKSIKTNPVQTYSQLYSDFAKMSISTKDQENNLEQNYVGANPYSFSTPQRVKQYYPQISQNKIKRKLTGVDVYSTFRKKRKSRTNPIYVHYPRQLFQADCVYFTDKKFTRRGSGNKGCKYLLVIIDCYTKYVWVKALRSLKCKETIQAFGELFNSIKPPETLQTDQGKEFSCQEMKNFLKQKKVFHYFSYGDRKSSIVERVNRSLQNIIYPLMYARRTHKWVELLPEMLQIYNSRKHRTINMSPENAEKDENKIRLAKTYRERYNLVGVKKPQFRKGELVRLQMKAKGGIKRREYLQSFTEDKYLIDRVLTKLPIPMYKVRKLNGDKVQGGSFYAWELSRTTS